ncbi:group II intron reverse transcriptase domain-containing protein [bacterium]|nr:group II intron reverse transcriptase domain-containing protein [bacterium]
MPVELSYSQWLRQELYIAYLFARHHKRSTVNQLDFELHLESNIEELVNAIATRNYQVHPGIAFVVDRPKIREVFAATFRDRVVHHLVYNHMFFYWEKHFIYDSYSCRPKKGTHFGIKRIHTFMRRATRNYTRPAWIMKMDISGYFMHIKKDLVWQFCQRMLDDPTFTQTPDSKDLLRYLLPIIIFHDPTQNVRLKGRPKLWAQLPPGKSLFHTPRDRGFPIGNLTSQLFSNIYLNELDQFVTHQLHIPYYGRYVDDFILIHQDKNYLLHCRQQIRDFLSQRLFLTLHPVKFYLQPVTYGVEFIGAKIFPHQVIASSRINRRLEEFIDTTYLQDQCHRWENSLASYCGHWVSYDRC